MPASPPVSVGLPVYNGAEYLEESLASILASTYGDFELLVADNASTDATGEICRAAAARDPRVRHLRADVNRGLAWNWNRLLPVASGRYFKWASHDDLWAPELLERCVATLDVAPPDVALCYPQTIDIGLAGEEIGPYVDDLDLREPTPSARFAHLLDRMARCNPLFGLMRIDVLRSTRLLGAFGHADRVLLGELCLRGQFWEVPERLFYRRVNEGVSMSLRANTSAGELARLYDASVERRYFFPMARRVREYVVAVAEAPISAAERARCMKVLARQWRLWRGVGGEVKMAARQALQSSSVR